MTPEQQKIIEQDAAEYARTYKGTKLIGRPFIAGATAVISNPGRYGVGGVWVKASERMPDDPERWLATNMEQGGMIVFCKVNGKLGVGYFYRVRGTLQFQYDVADREKVSEHGICVAYENFDQIEWLDESSPCAPDVSVLVSALEKLIRLKSYKDQHGKDEYYEHEQPLAWQQARNALKQFNP